jgi:hypothetical protein
MSDQRERSGRCLCGNVTYTFKPRELHIDACHCGMCQRWSGGPGLTVRMTSPANVEGEEFVSTYTSSEWGERQFCQNCGSHLFFHAPSLNYFGVSAGLALTTEIFIDKKPEAYAFANATRQMTEAEFLSLFEEPGDE